MKYNFSEVKLQTLDGTPVTDLCSALGNTIYVFTKDLSMVDIARDIYAGKSVDLTLPQITELKRLIEDEKAGFTSYVRKGLIDYLDKVEEKK